MRGQMKVVEFKKTEKISSNKILEDSKDKTNNVIVLGASEDGFTLYLSSNMVDKSSMVYLLEQVKLNIMLGVFDNKEEE
jgi:hypothetical protein